MTVNELELSVRAANVLNNIGIKTVEELVEFDWNEWARTANCGKLTVVELARAVVWVARGDALRQAKEFNKKYGTHEFAWARLHDAERKARLWDKIVEIVEPNEEVDRDE